MLFKCSSIYTHSLRTRTQKQIKKHILRGLSQLNTNTSTQTVYDALEQNLIAFDISLNNPTTKILNKLIHINSMTLDN